MTVASNPLPVSLIAFTGKKLEHTNLLEWKVTNETQFARYEVERSSDLKNFERIASVTAKSNEKSAVTNYDYADRTPQSVNSQTMYYRLKMVDIEGSYAYSRLIRISRDVIVPPGVHPNPALEVINIRVDITLLNAAAKIYDLGGRLVQTIWITKSDQQASLKNVASGLYIIKLQMAAHGGL